jgi:nucleoside-diphosphate-sugar epimerase
MMRIFLAGASGVIGLRLIPLLVAEGHEVAGMTRSPDKAEKLRELGAEPVVCDVYDQGALTAAVTAFGTELMMHQLTDLPDRIDQLAEYHPRNDRIRTEGTRNLIVAMNAAGAERLIAQSIAWRPPGREDVVEEHERLVLEVGGLVLEYGTFYGPGTFGGDHVPDHPRIHIDDAARRTVELLDAPTGVVVVAEEQ